MNVPDEYDGAAYEQNAAADLLLRAQMKAFQDPMKAAEADVMVVPVLADLQAAYDDGSPSLLDLTTAYYAPKVDAVLAELVTAAGNMWTPAEPPSGPGGIFGVHIYNANGSDLRQLTEKGLFNAALYNHAIVIAGGTLDEAAIDRLVAVFGAHPSFPGDSAAMTNKDEFMAVYAERRSPKDPADPSKPLDAGDPGPYFRIKRSLITAKAAIAAGCDVERDDAIASFLHDWEITNAGTIIYYLNDAAKKLTTPNPMTADLDGGLHGYGEAIAFLHGMRTVTAPGKVITDAEIDQLLADLGSPHDAPATAYKLLTDTAAEVPKLQAGIAMIAGIYGFTASQVETFKNVY
jgi:hypothetical protein